MINKMVILLINSWRDNLNHYPYFDAFCLFVLFPNLLWVIWLDCITELPLLDTLFICRSRDGFLSLIRAAISFNLIVNGWLYIHLFYTNSIFAFARLYLNVTFYLTISSGAAMKSSVSIPRNLYSRFSMKSNLA